MVTTSSFAIIVVRTYGTITKSMMLDAMAGLAGVGPSYKFLDGFHVLCVGDRANFPPVCFQIIPTKAVQIALEYSAFEAETQGCSSQLIAGTSTVARTVSIIADMISSLEIILAGGF